MRLGKVFLGVSLLVATPAGAAAQSAETDDAIGLGGRVVVVDAGYALTLPEDWIHVRPSGSDLSVIVEEARRIAPELGPTIAATLAGGLGFSLLAYDSEFDPAFTENCNMLDRPSEGRSIDAIGADEFAKLASFGDLMVDEPELTFIELPSGRAARLDLGLRLPDFDTASTSYLMTDGVWVHTLTCTDLVRPDDAWLPIAQTVEFLATPE
ncbi:MAG: hypothetical protein ACC726_10840 [Chloroflexota bacterium]